MDWISKLDGPSAVARIVGCKPPSVIEWRSRGVPPERCPAIERGSLGKVTCEEMRPDVVWHRIPDSDWPWHPEGRPAIDVAAPQPVATATSTAANSANGANQAAAA